MLRKIIVGLALAAGASLPLAGAAEAAVGDGVVASHIATQLMPIENAQFLWGGRQYCWYDDGWRGPGWYWCGYAYSSGYGWGGGYGWHGWRGGRRGGGGMHMHTGGGGAHMHVGGGGMHMHMGGGGMHMHMGGGGMHMHMGGGGGGGHRRH